MVITSNAFIAGGTASQVRVINTTPAAQTPVAAAGTIANVALTPDGTKGFAISSTGAGVITVFNPATSAIIATYTPPFPMAIGRATNSTLFLSPFGFATSITAMNVNTGAFTTVTGSTTFGVVLVMSPDLKTVYTPSSTIAHCLYAINTSTLAVTNMITPAGGGHANPGSIAVTPDSSTVYTFSSGTDDSIYYGPAGGTSLSGTIAMTFADQGIFAITQNGQWLIVGSGSDTVVISVASNAISHTDTGVATGAPAYPNPTANTYFASLAFNGYYVYGPAGTLVSSVSTPAFTNSLTISPDETTLYWDNAGSNTAYSYAIPANTLNGSVTFGPQTFGIVCVPAISTPPPPTVVVPSLFIPRKGFDRPYETNDYLANWMQIQIWANQWAPTLFIPCCPTDRPPTAGEIDQNWLAVENWAMNVAAKLDGVGPPTFTVPPLFIPRKHSLDPGDLTADFLAIQNWALGLYQQTH